MLIQDKHKPQRRRALLRLMLLTGGLLLFLLYIALRPAPSPYKDLPEGQIYCGAERTHGHQFQANGVYFAGGNTQSTACARHGRYGSRLPAADTLQTGMSYQLEEAQPGKAYRASIWYQSDTDSAAYLAAKVEGTTFRNWATHTSTVTDSSGWSCLELYFYVPYGKAETQWRVYAYSTGEAAVCFDDLLIEPVASSTRYQLPRLKVEAEAEQLPDVPLGPSGIAAILQSGSSSRLKARLSRTPASQTALQLKMQDRPWNGLHGVTLRPLRKAQQAENWLFRQLCAKAGLLSARYDFTEVYYNNRSAGLYAYEEALDSHFIYRIPYPTGLIVQISDFGESPYPVVQTVHPALDSLPATQAQLSQAQRLLTQYQSGELPLSQAVEVEELAAYFATATLLGCFPTQQRWYYNPATAKLHPVAWGELEKVKNRTPARLRQLMRDEAFAAFYCSMLDERTQADSARAWLEPLAADWAARASYALPALRDSLPDMREFLGRIARLRQQLLPQSDYALTAYTQSVRGPDRALQILNQHQLPIQVVGYGRDSKRMLAGLERPLLLWPAAWQPADSDSLFAFATVGAAATHLFYRLPGVDRLFASPILSTSAPLTPTDWQSLLSSSAPATGGSYKISGKRVVFPAGEHRLRKTLVVPEGYRLVLEAGAEIFLDQNASIISLGQVQAMGTAQLPVKIEAAYRGGGLALLQAQKKSTLAYVLMQNLKPPAYGDWQLSGGFTIYGSEASLRHCAWLKGRGEAAVHFVRASVEAQDCLVSEATQDGWQWDYSRGSLRSCRFEQCRRSGLVITDSRVELQEARFKDNERYGLRAKANARLKASGGQIKSSLTGIGISDGARLDWAGLRLEDCPTGFAAFQKKPEFGPAQITITGLEVDAVDQLQNASGLNRIIID
ncbi:MAG: hypothetical protein GVY26_01860 [Bacteroidetes bacterium]|jgi:hypothetical protein|nr:hypothetical protein [Bacteroidota bacterium]